MGTWSPDEEVRKWLHREGGPHSWWEHEAQGPLPTPQHTR